MLIEASNVIKAFGAFKAVDDASVSVEEGDILGLIGPNGAGKSTFFNCLTGDLPVDLGQRRLRRQRRHAPAARRRGRGSGSRAPSRCRSPSNRCRCSTTPRSARCCAIPTPRDARAKARDVLQRVGLGHCARRAGAQPRHARPQAAGDRPRARLRAQGAAARRGDGRADADRGAGRDRAGAPASTSGGITIVIVEHIMEVIVSLARRVVVFHQGREIARGTPREVTSNQAVIEAYLGRRKVRHVMSRAAARSSISRCATAT